MENVEATSRNITIPVTQLDFLQHAVHERDKGDRAGEGRGQEIKPEARGRASSLASKKPKPGVS